MTPSYVLVRYALVGFVGLAFGGAAAWAASRPTRTASRLGMRGLMRQRALARPTWSAVEPVVRWAGVRVSGVLSEATRARLDRALTHAGDFLGLTADEYAALVLLSSAAFGVAGVLAAYADSRAMVAVPLLVVLGAMIPHVVIDSARVGRFRALNRGLPYAIDLISLSMSAGLDFPGAVRQVVSKAKANDALRDELAYVLQQLHLGRTRVQVLRGLAERAPIESVREFVHALVQAEERGTPVANALEIQASAARIRRTNLAESAASDMRGKMVLPTMMIVGVSLMLIAVPSTMLIEKISGGLR